MSLIEELYNLNDSIVDLTIDYYIKKMELNKKEAKLLLETDFETVLNTKRPTVGEKEAWITLQTVELKDAVVEAQAELDSVKRGYDIKKMEVKYQGNFLNTIAGVVRNDD